MAKSGKLIIFNMEEFQQETIDNLPGNKNDVRILQETFQKYNVDIDTVYKDYTLKEVKAVMKQIEREDFSAYKYLVVAILTHGDRKEFLLSSDEIFDLDKEIIFPILRNRSLINKPKLFIINSCKGKYDLIEADTNATRFYDDEAQHAYCPRQIMRCFATTEGFKAYGTEEYGSYFVQVFCTKLQEKGDTVSIKNIMEESISGVQEKSMNRQMPCIVHNMTLEECEAFTLGKML